MLGLMEPCAPRERKPNYLNNIESTPRLKNLIGRALGFLGPGLSVPTKNQQPCQHKDRAQDNKPIPMTHEKGLPAGKCPRPSHIHHHASLNIDAARLVMEKLPHHTKFIDPAGPAVVAATKHGAAGLYGAEDRMSRMLIGGSPLAIPSVIGCHEKEIRSAGSMFTTDG